MSHKITSLRTGDPVVYRDYFQWQHLHPGYWPGWLGIGLLWLLSRLPFDLQLKVGRGLGTLLYYLLPSRRKVTLTNLKLAFPSMPDNEITSLAKVNYKHVGMGVAEAASFWFRPTQDYVSRFSLEDAHHLDQALAQGKGVILLQAHFTLVDFTASVMCQHYQVYAVYAKSKNAMFGALLKNRRERYMQEMIENHDIRRMVRQLKKGSLIWYSPDQYVSARRGGVATPYFGQPAMTTPGTARIAAMTGAIVIPMIPIRLTDGGRYKLTFYPPLDLSGLDSDAATLKVNQLFEKQVKEQPDQYLWMHKRFKPIDSSQPNPYSRASR
ncbi:MAG: lysophospholipid acyltransferase family protein [Granulosicoccus sp.]|nr:lysophospholipid acyltransferase family protein [Granulosicoccus sp.]